VDRVTGASEPENLEFKNLRALPQPLRQGSSVAKRTVYSAQNEELEQKAAQRLARHADGRITKCMIVIARRSCLRISNESGNEKQ
jgi:hypothetical protein